MESHLWAIPYKKVIHIKRKRIFEIQKMLLEMAGGNFFYRLERRGKKDELEGVEMALNLLAEELNDSFVSSIQSFSHSVQMSFLINGDDGTVQSANEKASQFLQVPTGDITGRPFTNFLQAESKKIWRRIMLKLQKEDFADTSLNLKIMSKNGLSIPNRAQVTTFHCPSKNERTILVVIVLQTRVQSELDNRIKEGLISYDGNGEIKVPSVSSKPKKGTLVLNNKDREKLKKAHDLIVSHPEKKLPPLKRFALQLGTNEFKLKHGFRELYGSSVHQFLMNERFRRIIVLVQYSDFSLKHIAHMMGFESYPHFCRTFKKRYGYSASSLRQKALAEKRERSQNG